MPRRKVSQKCCSVRKTGWRPDQVPLLWVKNRNLPDSPKPDYWLPMNVDFCCNVHFFTQRWQEFPAAFLWSYIKVSTFSRCPYPERLTCISIIQLITWGFASSLAEVGYEHTTFQAVVKHPKHWDTTHLHGYELSIPLWVPERKKKQACQETNGSTLALVFKLCKRLTHTLAWTVCQ